MNVKIGDRVYVHGQVDEVRKDVIIIRNDGGYFGTVPSELVVAERFLLCKECKNWVEGYITDQDDFIPPKCGKYQQMVGHSSNDYCSLAERRTDESDANP